MSESLFRYREIPVYKIGDDWEKWHRNKTNIAEIFSKLPKLNKELKNYLFDENTEVFINNITY
jgi:hypothetical protein